MALTIEIIGVSFDKYLDKKGGITLNLRCSKEIPADGEIDAYFVDVINKNFTFYYQSDDDIEVKIKGVLQEMQDEIDKYKKEEQIFNSAKFISAATWIQNNLVG